MHCISLFPKKCSLSAATIVALSSDFDKQNNEVNSSQFFFVWLLMLAIRLGASAPYSIFQWHSPHSQFQFFWSSFETVEVLNECQDSVQIRLWALETINDHALCTLHEGLLIRWSTGAHCLVRQWYPSFLSQHIPILLNKGGNGLLACCFFP